MIPSLRRTLPRLPGFTCGLLVLAGAWLVTESSRAASGRYTPMPEAPRSLYFALTTNLHVAFDTDRLRLHTAWTGPGLNLQGTPHTGNKTPFISEARGDVFFTTRPVASWWLGRQPPAMTNLPVADRQFRGWSHRAAGPALSYQIGEGPSRADVEEALLHLPGPEPSFARCLTVTTGDEEVWFVPFAELVDSPEIRRLSPEAIALHHTNHWLVITSHPGPANGAPTLEQFRVQTGEVDLAYPVETARDGDSERIVVHRSGRFVRILQRFPAQTRGQLNFAIIAVPELPDDPTDLTARWRVDLASLRPGESAVAQAPVVIPSAGPSPPMTDDDPYAIESFALPPEVALQVTGMDWLANGDLAVCTWSGDVWIFEQLAGDSAPARYRRFAEGLNEPLGVAVVGGDVVVAQKPELTRLRDTNGDGRADRFDCLNDDWGFTGNYHAFTFGPAVDAAGDFLLAFCGQRARWDVEFASWLVRIAPDGSRLEPVAGGLRAPNGIGFYGPDRDVFVTDNQGNWIGACKLNQVRAGRTYGYPVAQPGTREQWDHPADDFDPPAVWFPRKLAPSAAGFATVPDTGFGPFGGQLVVADFQNATVLRVALERVNGQWQGAVFPFLSGFGSGSNRVLFDRRGRLYVGGVKNQAWPSAGPREQSLERVTFNGKTPFDVQQVAARPDGFELTFTRQVNREFAGDPGSYSVSQFHYRHHQEYGSPEFNHDGQPGRATMIEVAAAEVDPTGRRVGLRLKGWRAGYVTRVLASGVEDTNGELLRSEEFYYTLNAIPSRPGSTRSP